MGICRAVANRFFLLLFVCFWGGSSNLKLFFFPFLLPIFLITFFSFLSFFLSLFSFSFLYV
ncbi:hypothetical protein DFP73DRAFT_561161 [Morchella snyderi]|nr:hypothetical protein DFP73DRAFT_561161 [Morchella snyderi]